MSTRPVAPASVSQVLFALGNGLVLLYYEYFSLWAVAIPMCLELALIVLLIGVKLYFEKTHHGRKQAAAAALAKLAPLVRTFIPTVDDEEGGSTDGFSTDTGAASARQSGRDNSESGHLEEKGRDTLDDRRS